MTNSFGERLRRGAASAYFPVIAVVASVVISGAVMWICGFDPFYAFGTLLNGALGGANNIGETLVKMTPLLFSALSFAVAMRCGIFNIGATGQMYIGAIFGSLVGTQMPDLPGIIHIPLMLLLGAIGGGLYGLLAGFLKHRFGANELIVTTMLNYIAIQVLSYCVAGPLKDPATAATSTPQSAMMVDSVQLPGILPGTRLHAGFLLALAFLVLFYIFLWKTPRGYEMRVVGLNPNAGRYAGISVRSNQMLAMFIAGGLAGIGGCVEIMSVQSRLIQQFAGNIGFDGIAVALLGGCSPLGMFGSGLLFGVLSSGANKMQMLAKVPSAMVDITQSLIILFVVGRELFRFAGRKKAKKAAAAVKGAK